MFWLKSMTLLAEMCSFLGDAERAACCTETLLRMPSDAWSTHPWPPARARSERSLGQLASTLGRAATRRIAHFEAASSRSTRASARAAGRSHAARIRVACCSRAVERAIASRRAELLGQALATTEELGMTSLGERARALKAEAGGRTAGWGPARGCAVPESSLEGRVVRSVIASSIQGYGDARGEDARVADVQVLEPVDPEGRGIGPPFAGSALMTLPPCGCAEFRNRPVRSCA